MIKFFRHFRKRLISENRFSKYLIYAIGEIFLVVIGILIALQINNWNELKKKNQLKNEYIISLKSDYTKDTTQLNNTLLLNRIEIKNLTKLKDSFAVGDFTTLEDFKSLFNQSGGILRLTNTYNTNSFNLLVSSGNIDLLHKELREEIMELNRLQNFTNGVTLNNRDYFFRFMENISLKYPSSLNPFNTKVPNGLLWNNVNMDALPRDLTSYLGQYEFTIVRYVQLTESVVLQTEKVLNMLIQEYD